ncbi:universal stress protein [Phycicoccus duodecadis]|uniref:Nucleotide-binding universal stress UspA family protein n=1 Tax=Phycicoccus duodecadis TaxID=173053 RepID=A0A2N3YF69_9MICO|nr:universal stress protein [Phycicoccus duodecadis]PKW25507.1 nucleotide-binding universal stress UspA family protein [Phycicoccus duodecadis]
MNSTLRPIVVGVDLAGSSEPALEWAAAEAARRGRPLRILHAYPPPTYPSTGAGLLPGGTVVTLGEELRKAAVAEVADCAVRVRVAHPDLEVQTFTHCGPAAATLLEASRHAETVVLGSRGLSTVAGIVLGSVSTPVCARSVAPVVVVRYSPHAAPDAPVVVGVDGSGTSRAALAFAAAQASSRRVGLTVVHTWRVDGTEGDGSSLGWSTGWGRLPEEEEAVLAEAVAGLGEQFPDVVVHREVVSDYTADALERLSRDACLLVVGTHGRGTVSGWLRGSVSQAVLRAAPCPVAVVHPAPDEDDHVGGDPPGSIEPAVPASPAHDSA